MTLSKSRGKFWNWSSLGLSLQISSKLHYSRQAPCGIVAPSVHANDQVEFNSFFMASQCRVHLAYCRDWGQASPAEAGKINLCLCHTDNNLVQAVDRILGNIGQQRESGRYFEAVCVKWFSFLVERYWRKALKSVCRHVAVLTEKEWCESNDKKGKVTH